MPVKEKGEETGVGVENYVATEEKKKKGRIE